MVSPVVFSGVCGPEAGLLPRPTDLGNRSIKPAWNAICSAVYSCDWSAVAAWLRPSRNGLIAPSPLAALEALGLRVRRAVSNPFTCGVFGAATNFGSPGGFVACG